MTNNNGNRGVSRRRFLKVLGAGATVAATGLVAGPAVAKRAPGEPTDLEITVIGGLVVATALDSIDIENDGVITRIHVQPEARLYSGVDFDIPDASRFVLGDDIAAEGHYLSDKTFEAREVGSRFFPTEFIIHSVDLDRRLAHTSIGELDFSGELNGRGVNEVRDRIGEPLVALAWEHPIESDLYLLLAAPR